MDAHIVWLSDDGAVPTTDLLSVLEPADRQESIRYRDPARLRSFALSRRLLRQTLGNLLQTNKTGIRLARADSGRLQLASPDHLHISLSHAAGLVAVIVAPAPCGVDIERLRTVNADRIARRYFTTTEYDWLQQHPATRETDFFRFWTLKEACVKALGVGLAHHLATLAFDIANDTPQQLDDGERMALWQQAGPGLVLAAAVKTTEPVNWQATHLTIDGL